LLFPFWASTFHAELAAGLWRALAAPWLAPGRPAHTGAAPRPEASERGTAVGPADSTDRRQIEAVAAPRCQVAPGAGGQVIRVPHARWRQRRG
jgi:hypothetical protein